MMFTSRFESNVFSLFRVGYNIKKLLKEENLYRDRGSQIEAINRTFEDVKRPVKQHYSKPGVYALQELPVLPDFDVCKSSNIYIYIYGTLIPVFVL